MEERRMAIANLEREGDAGAVLGQGQAPTATVAAPEAAAPETAAAPVFVRALKDYTPTFLQESGGQIGFKKGDKMEVRDRRLEDWLKVKFGYKLGYVPRSHVEFVDSAPVSVAHADPDPQGWRVDAKVMKVDDDSSVGTILKIQGMRARVDFGDGKGRWLMKKELKPATGTAWGGGGYRKRRNKTRKQRKKNIKKRTKKSTRKRTKKHTKKRTKKKKNSRKTKK
jgi:hypothetical protein